MVMRGLACFVGWRVQLEWCRFVGLILGVRLVYGLWFPRGVIAGGT